MNIQIEMYLKKNPFCNKKKWPYKRVVSLEGENKVIFYHLCVSEIRPDWRDGL
jgi:hypothetical protein